MKKRCYNINDKDYHTYGARGIDVCLIWQTDFQAFYDWCLEQGYRQGLYLDRDNNDQGYSPVNCRFVTNLQNCRNQRRTVRMIFQGRLMSVNDVLDILRIPYQTYQARIQRGWTHKRAATEPSQPKGSNQYGIYRS